MVDNSYVLKTARPIAIVQLICGLISVPIGIFTSWNQDHTVITKLKPNGLPLWGGILFILTGCVGILITRGPKKCMIYGFMLLCALSVIAAFVMYRVLMPLLLSGNQDIPWNLCNGSYLAFVSIICVISMKGIYICLKATFMYDNCFQKAPPRQRRHHPSMELMSSGCTSSTAPVEEGRNEQRQAHRVDYTRSITTSPLASSGHRNHRHTHSHGRRERERSTHHSHSHQTPLHQMQVRLDERPPPPSFQTMNLPHLPTYHEVVGSPPPPPYTEKEVDIVDIDVM